MSTRCLESLIYTAQRAGGAIMAVYATDFAVRDKADASPVTVADEAAEKIILADLAAIAPGIPGGGRRVRRGRPGAGGRGPLLPRRSARWHARIREPPRRVHRERRAHRKRRARAGVVFAPARHELFWGDVRAGKAGHIDADPDGTMPSMGSAIQRATAAGGRPHRRGLAFAPHTRDRRLPG